MPSNIGWHFYFCTMLYHHITGNSMHTIVLVHGFCENHSCFNSILPSLGKHYKVICPDLPGFGKSDCAENTSMEVMADCLKELLDSLNISKCVMLGHSMGGYVILAFANKYPEYLSALGLMHSTAVADDAERLEKRKQVINFIAKNGKEVYINNFIPTLFRDKDIHKVACDRLIEEAKSGPQQGFLEAVKAMMIRRNQEDFLMKSDLSIFFAVGKYDSLIPEIDMLKQASTCKQSEICYLEQTAHCGMLEEPEKLSNAIIKFCDRVLK